LHSPHLFNYFAQLAISPSNSLTKYRKLHKKLPHGKIVEDRSSMADMNNNTTEVLSFRLGGEEYALSILKVQEIRGYDNVTRIASAPEYLKGVVNLRGIIVPIVDMRIKFNVGNPTYDAFTVVIILNINGHTIGVVVDSVSDVVTLNPDQIKPAPDLGASVAADYLQGLGTVGERMLILIDIDKLLSAEDMGLLTAARSAD
jgi:purine-binding chemotaxis protein CheW